MLGQGLDDDGNCAPTRGGSTLEVGSGQRKILREDLLLMVATEPEALSLAVSLDAGHAWGELAMFGVWRTRAADAVSRHSATRPVPRSNLTGWPCSGCRGRREPTAAWCKSRRKGSAVGAE